MTFASFHFVLFAAVVICLYYRMPHRGRWALLLAASSYFYACWIPGYLMLLACCTAVNYLAGLLIHSTDGMRRKGSLVLGLVGSIGVLFAFKYINFMNAALRPISDTLGMGYPIPDVTLVVPLGISFYTLQALSYTIDVYRGARKPETHLGIFALYVSFFPQLVAGPIERSTRLLPQFHQEKTFCSENAVSGLRLILWGYFKKLVVADRAGSIVDVIYLHPDAVDGAALWLGTFLFSIQIFCDFSAYTDIARGTARIMGFELMENFRQPYLATSLTRFWRRWHISLSTWFRDYLYIPLGGSRVTGVRIGINIGVVFILSGLWHGANWTFIAWGGIHGVALSMERMIRRVLRFPDSYHRSVLTRLLFTVGRITVTQFVVLSAWVFFRCPTIAEGWIAIEKMLRLPAISGYLPPELNMEDLLLLIPFLFLVAAREIIAELRFRNIQLPGCPQPLRWAADSALLWAVVIFGWMAPHTFIYFVF